jgi:hypothetical protein
MIDRYNVIFFSLALDAQPFLPLIYSELRKLDFDWSWWIMEGVAASQHCTKWVKQLPPRLSTDGTNGYLKALASFDKRVHHIERELWPGGKVQMCNYPLKQLHEPKLLWQMDADEIWTAEQITKTRNLFIRHKAKNCAYFRCRYFVGPDIAITSRDGFGNNSAYEWLRVWKIEPGMRWLTHEPPKMGGLSEIPFTHDETEKEGLVFDHFAYATPAQVEFKQAYYGSPNNEKGSLYHGLLDKWRRLQRNEKWPVTDLRPWMPFVGEGVTAARILA